MTKFKIFTERYDNDKWDTVDESANRWMEKNGKNVDVLSMSFSDGLICIMYEEKSTKETLDVIKECDTCKYRDTPAFELPCVKWWGCRDWEAAE